jgi:hypothetical protein
VANTRHPRLESSSVVASPKPDEVPVIRAVRMISILDLNRMFGDRELSFRYSINWAKAGIT